jgi:hypothetical protein
LAWEHSDIAFSGHSILAPVVYIGSLLSPGQRTLVVNFVYDSLYTVPTFFGLVLYINGVPWIEL